MVEQLFKQLNEDVFPVLKPLLDHEGRTGSKLVEDSLRAANKLDAEGSVTPLGSGQLMKGLGLLHSHLLVLGHVVKIGHSVSQVGKPMHGLIVI